MNIAVSCSPQCHVIEASRCSPIDYL